MKTARILAIGFSVFAVLGMIGLAFAGPPRVAFAQGAETSTVTATPEIGDTGTITSTETVTPTVTVTATVPVTATPPVTATVAPNQKVAAAIAKFYDVPLDDILAMRDQGMGYGEIVIAFNLANKTGKSVEEILSMRKSGEGWGKIAQDLAVKPGNKGGNLGGIMSGHAQPPTGEGNTAPSGSAKGNGNGNGKGNGNGNGKK